jgi:hypothetical protein
MLIHRYVMLIDQMCRDLVDTGMRQTNPAESSAPWRACFVVDPELV